MCQPDAASIIEYSLNFVTLMTVAYGFKELSLSYGMSHVSKMYVSGNPVYVPKMVLGIPSMRTTMQSGFMEYKSVTSRIGPIIKSRFDRWPLVGYDALSMLCMHEFAHAVTYDKNSFNSIRPHQVEFSVNLGILVDTYGGIDERGIHDQLRERAIRPYEIVQDAC